MRDLPRVAFMKRFTIAERIVLRNKARDGTQLGGAVDDFLWMISMMEWVSLDDTYVRNALTVAEAQGLLAPGRADAILGD